MDAFHGKAPEDKKRFLKCHHMTNLFNVTNFPNMYVGMRICVDLRVREFPPFEGYFF